jgi:hypothetical protein
VCFLQCDLIWSPPPVVLKEHTKDERLALVLQKLEQNFLEKAKINEAQVDGVKPHVHSAIHLDAKAPGPPGLPAVPVLTGPFGGDSVERPLSDDPFQHSDSNNPAPGPPPPPAPPPPAPQPQPPHAVQGDPIAPAPPPPPSAPGPPPPVVVQNKGAAVPPNGGGKSAKPAGNHLMGALNAVFKKRMQSVRKGVEGQDSKGSGDVMQLPVSLMGQGAAVSRHNAKSGSESPHEYSSEGE